MVGFSWPCGCCGSYFTMKKFNSSAELQWSLNGTDQTGVKTTETGTAGFAVNNDGSVIHGGSRLESGNGNGYFSVAKWDTDLSFAWGANDMGANDKKISVYAQGVVVDNDGNIWVAGHDAIIKYNQSGLKLLELSTHADYRRASNLRIGSNGDIYALRVRQPSLGSASYYISRNTTSGTEIFDTLIESPTRTVTALSYVMDGSDNIYISDGSSSRRMYKFDEDMALVHESYFSDDDFYSRSSAVNDSSFFISSKSRATGEYYIKKYDLSGNYVSSIDVDNQADLTLDSSGNLYAHEVGSGTILKYNTSGAHVETFDYASPSADLYVYQMQVIGTDLYCSGNIRFES